MKYFLKHVKTRREPDLKIVKIEVKTAIFINIEPAGVNGDGERVKVAKSARNARSRHPSVQGTLG